MNLYYKKSDRESTYHLATDVRIADTFTKKAIGLIGKREIQKDYALVFNFANRKKRTIHTFGVRFPIKVIWVTNNTVTKISQLKPWKDFDREEADMVIEVSPENNRDIEVNDKVWIDRNADH